MSSNRFRIRTGRPADAPAAATITVEGWRATFHGILPPAFLKSLSVPHRTEALAARFENPDYSMVVAENQNGDVIGFADWGPSREERWLSMREVYAIYVLPDSQGAGVGKALISEVGRSVESFYLSVLAVNPNVGFYRHLGGEELERGLINIADKEYDTIYFAWRNGPPNGLG